MANPYLLAGGALAAGFALERGAEAMRHKRQFGYPLIIDLASVKPTTLSGENIYAVNVRDNPEYASHFPQLPFQNATIVVNLATAALIEFSVNDVTYYVKNGQTLEIENLAVRQFTVRIPSSVSPAKADVLITLYNKADATARAV